MKKSRLEGVLPAPAGLEASARHTTSRGPNSAPEHHDPFESTNKRRFSFNTIAGAAGALRLRASLPSLPIWNPSTSSAQATTVDDPRSIMPTTHRQNTPLHALRNTFDARAAARPGTTVEHEGFAKLTGHVVMLGGYRGSVLRDTKTGKRIWAPMRTALGLRTADLSLGLTDADELRSEETVKADKMLTTVAGIVEMGRSLKVKLNALEKAGQITWTNFGFDWRRSLDLSSAELLALVERSARVSGQGVTVVAHSMGGLVALHALARAKDPSVFARILFAGTPFDGCPNCLGPLRFGDVLGRNADICSPRAVFSMRSIFYFLPPSEHQVFEKANGQPVETDFFSVEVGLPIVAKGDEPTSEQNWSRFGFSLVAQDVLQPDSKARQLALRIAEHAAPEADESGSPATSDDPELLPIAPSLSSGSPSMQSLRRLSLPPDPDLTSFTHPDDPAIVSYLRRTLEKVQSFRHDLTTLYDPSKASSYPSLGIIASSTTATVRGVRVDSEQDIVAGDFSRLLFDHGDGIVLHSSATALPACWTPHLKVTEASTYGHVSLLSDLDVVDRALARLL